jgi:hypothetical protein
MTWIKTKKELLDFNAENQNYFLFFNPKAGGYSRYLSFFFIYKNPEFRSKICNLCHKEVEVHILIII